MDGLRYSWWVFNKDKGVNNYISVEFSVPIENYFEQYLIKNEMIQPVKHIEDFANQKADGKEIGKTSGELFSIFCDNLLEIHLKNITDDDVDTTLQKVEGGHN